MNKSQILWSLLCGLFLTTQGLQAHISYSGRDFGTDPDGASITNQTVSGSFGWAVATDDDWGDSHQLRAFRFTLTTSSTVTILVERNSLGNGPVDTFLPAFSLYYGLSHRGLNEGVWQDDVYRTEALAHDSSPLSVASRPEETAGSFRALDDWSVGNDPTYVTAGDPTSGILIDARLVYFTYIGHAADGTSANFGSAPGILGDGVADGSVSLTFYDLAPGNYSLFVGGANHAAGDVETNPYPTYGINVTVTAVPEPATAGLLTLGAVALAWTIHRRSRSRNTAHRTAK